MKRNGQIGKYFLLIVCILLLFILGNLYTPKIATWYNNKTFTSASTADSRYFERLLRDAAYKTIQEETWNGMLGSYKTLLSYLSPDVSVYEYGEFGLLMHYSYLYGKARNDNELCKLIKDKFDNRVITGGGIIRNDQTTYGLVALDLYGSTHDKRYKRYADEIYSRLDSLHKRDGIVIYNNKHSEQRVDGIGLVCPFLFSYSSMFNNNSAREIANKMCQEFVRLGSDSGNGIPSKAYGLKSHIKHTSPNWGRGISWYLIGTYNMDKNDSLISKRLELLDSILLLDTDKLYPQFLDEEGLPDMSATIPIIWHLQEKKLINMSMDDLTRLISPYCDSKGVLRYCSPVLSSNTGVNNQKTNLFAQGVLLYLFSMKKK